MADVDQLNVKEEAMIYGINKFSDLTQEEFRSKYLGKSSDIRLFSETIRSYSEPSPESSVSEASSPQREGFQLQAVADWSR